MALEKRRWLILVMCIVVNMCQGGAYAFSVFKKPLAAVLGLTKEAAPAQLGLAFSLMLAMLPVGMLLSGKIVDKKGPKAVVLVGGIILGIGFFLSGFSSSLLWLYMTMGVMTSIGSGMAYGAVVSTAVRWFPDRRGLASGLAIAALGLGTLIISNVAPLIMQHMGAMEAGPLSLSPAALEALGVLATLKVLGVAFVILIAIASFFIVSPEAGWVPAGYQAAKGPAKAPAQTDYVWTQIIAMPKFWILFLLYILGVAPGFMLLPNLKPLAEAAKMDSVMAALVTGVVAGLANSLGRLFWGAVSDKLGRLYAMTLMFALSAVCIAGVTLAVGNAAVLVSACVLVLLCYGGFLGIFPSISAEAFGPKNMSVNYGVLFISFSISGLLSPQIVAKMGPGNEATAFVYAGLAAMVGMIIASTQITAKAKA